MHVQVLVNKLCFGMNWQEAGDAPRMFHEGDSSPTGATMRDGGTVFLEDGWPEKTRRELARRGHRLGGDSDAYGGYQAIARDVTRGLWIGASESRKDGMAAGW
jgi:gamma-glutamyltranspeptidase/glutathione hydrolase